MASSEQECATYAHSLNPSHKTKASDVGFIMSQEKVDQAQEAFDKGGTGELLKFAQEKLDQWKMTEVNIAVVGQSGCGKSSFINTLRSVHDPEDRDYAETDVVECTTVPTSFHFPNNRLIKMWDLPGAGTENFRASKYASEMSFLKYDAFVILSCDRFTEIDQMIAEEAKKLGKQIFFSRTKMDIAMKSQKKKFKSKFDKVKEAKKIKDSILEKLDTTEDKIFLIVNLPDDDDDMLKDFPDNDNERLKSAIVRSLPELQKTALGRKPHQRGIFNRLKAFLPSVLSDR